MRLRRSTGATAEGEGRRVITGADILGRLLRGSSEIRRLTVLEG
ncbi:hypothetical protein [Methanothrix harundinacea]|jgi:hypothetical protein|nr:hypothetical protein [Methanothrix harundinacea]